MIWFRRVLLAVLATALSTHATYADDATLSFVRRHCVECHGDKKQAGGVRLDGLTGDMSNDGPRWMTAAEQVRRGLMPPEDAKQPSATAKTEFVNSVRHELAVRTQRKPNLGNLVAHELLFEKAAASNAQATEATAPRLWRLSPDAYSAWVNDVACGTPKGVVQPFSAGAERGVQDFAQLARVDEPAAEILLRNALTIVKQQTRHDIVDGKVQAKNDTVREFTDLMSPTAMPTREQLLKALSKQFRLALGREPDEADVAHLLKFYERCASGGDRPGAVTTMLTAVLLRSDVIFRSEFGGPDGMLTPREVANAISVTLCNRRDEALRKAVDLGQLVTREQIAEHVRRILDDPKIAKPRLLGFFRDYFEYHKAVEVFKDEPKDLWHRPDQAVRDTDRLVLHLIAEDEDLFRRMLTTPLAFANVKMSIDKATRKEVMKRSLIPNAHNQRGKSVPEELYGLKEWTDQQPFAQPANTRLGLLMQPSWLIAWSENFHTDIVRRGRFIRERLLGGTVPDLPIGVAAMVPNDRTHTLRERVSSVTRAESCWKCHQHMDDLGLPFENFDHYGRLLDQDWVLDAEATAKNVDYKGKPKGDVLRGVPLDTAGLISGTDDPKLDGPLKDPREFVTRLANSDRCRQVWIRHIFRYYLGRNETLADAPSLQAADRAYVGSNRSYKALLVSLLTSDSFLKRGPQR